MTAQPRRMGVEGSTTRTLFVDAAEAILRDVGYLGISARQVAAKAGLKTQLLYYYFRTMDELVLAVVRRINAGRQSRFDEALASADSLRALLELNSDPAGATLSAEITSIAGHRDAIRAEIIRYAEQFRRSQIAAVSRLMPAQLKVQYPPAGIVMIAVALSRVLVSEQALGLTIGHDEARAIIERFMDALSVI